MNSVPDPNVRVDQGGWISGPSGGTEQDPHAAYYLAVEAEDSRLDAVLASLRQQEDSGHVTVREAADARVAALERHLAACRQLRRRYLGGS